jgi:alanine racemase
LDRRPVKAIIDLNTLKQNFLRLKNKLSGRVRVLGVVKADAYGHGAVQVSIALEEMGCDFLGVTSCEEGIRLRDADITLPILIMSGVYVGQLKDILYYDLTPVVFNSHIPKLLNRLAGESGRVVNVHLKVDTGIGRLGVLPDEVPSILAEIAILDNIKIEGVLTHLAEADKEESEFSIMQIEKFEEVINTMEDLGFVPEFMHIENSAAIIDRLSSSFNLVRPGIMLYGSYPSERLRFGIELLPAMSLSTEIIQVKQVPKGRPISYGRTFVTGRESIIATIPIGYGDGYLRALSNSGVALVRGKRVNVVGRVCMDLTMLDVTDVPGVGVGEEVILLGVQGDEMITAEELAKKAGTISYEVFCNINQRVYREYIR